MEFVEILVNIFAVLVESLFISFFFAIIFVFIDKDDKKYLNKKLFFKYWLLNIFVVGLNRVIHILLPTFKWIKPLTTILCFSLSTRFTYGTKIYKGVIGTVAFLIISAILEILTAMILIFLDVNPEIIANNIYYNSIYACALALLEALVSYLIYKISRIFKKGPVQTRSTLHYFGPQLIAIIICLLPTMSLLMMNDFQYSTLFIIVNIIQLVAVALVGAFNLKFVEKHENTELQLANTITYNETLKKVNEGVRGFKHDMGNIVQAILGYIAINDSDGAKKYCQNLVIGFNDINVLSILSPQVINDPAIYGVVVNKILVAREQDMNLSLDVNLDASDINFPKFELSRILGILIDNAIEAGKQTIDKKLIVNMRHDHKRNADIIVISNSINDANIDTNKIFEKNYSTKEKPSGFGLYEVNKFIKKNKHSYIMTTINKDEMLFTQTLTIYNNKS